MRPAGEACRSRIAAGAAIDHDLAQRPLRRRLPAGPVRDDDVREIEDLLPAVPVRQAEEGVHAQQQAQRALRKFLAQLGQRIDRVGRARCAALRDRRR